MAREISVALSLPRETLLKLGQAARLAGCSPTDYLDRVLTRAFAPPVLPDLPTYPVLDLAFRSARDWFELQSRLRVAGYVLRLAQNGGLTLHNWPFDEALLPIEEVGQSRAGLTLRFGAPFPDTGRRDPRFRRNPSGVADRAA